MLTITQVLSLLTLPATLGLALVADDLIAVAFGPKWVNAATPLQLLALYAALRSITSFFAPLLNVTGHSRFLMWNHILGVLYFATAFYFGSRLGVIGIALMWPLLYPFLAVPMYIRVFKQINLSFRVYMAYLRPALTGSLIMVAVVLMLKKALLFDAAYLRLLVEIATGAVIYSLAVAGLFSGQLRGVLALIRPATPKLVLAAERN